MSKVDDEDREQLLKRVRQGAHLEQEGQEQEEDDDFDDGTAALLGKISDEDDDDGKQSRNSSSCGAWRRRAARDLLIVGILLAGFLLGSRIVASQLGFTPTSSTTTGQSKSSSHEEPSSFQPKVTIAVKKPSPAYSSISMSVGAPWCNGGPSVWITGHQGVDVPWCRESDGSFQVNSVIDNLAIHEPKKHNWENRGVDRHGCGLMDVNYDSLPDIICACGAAFGTGRGWTELYLTQPNGTVTKVMDHPLHKYPTMRGRLILPLDGADGSKLVFLGVYGVARKDGKMNQHQMFRLLPLAGPPFFEEVEKDGPWLNNYIIDFAITADVNGDGIDDIITGNERGKMSHMYIQLQNTTFLEINLPPMSKGWLNARASPVSQKNRPDLVVLIGPQPNIDWLHSHRLVIFKGIEVEPYFDFENPIYRLDLPYPTHDVEIINVNGDSYADIYITQSTGKGYCGANAKTLERKYHHYQNESFNRGNPPDGWVPPIEETSPDILLIGQQPMGKEQVSFQKVSMEFAYPGCSNFVEKFGNDRTLVLAQGDKIHLGQHLLLEW